MKRLMTGLATVIMLTTPCNCILAGGFGDSFAGGALGGTVGGMVGSAIARPRRETVVVQQPAPVVRPLPAPVNVKAFLDKILFLETMVKELKAKNAELKAELKEAKDEARELRKELRGELKEDMAATRRPRAPRMRR
jgi:FtsZ-binding cell division protein ZapB